ncbi:MAG: adenosylcobinamide-GDP ribazoletransferase [Planctomycetia bacterium]
MKNWPTEMAAAFGLLTIAPTPGVPTAADFSWGRAVVWFPLVGAAVGLVQTAVALKIVMHGGEDALRLAAVAAVAVGALLTGGLHFDGWADCADAFGVRARGRDAMLRVMRDPALGSFGVLALILAVYLQVEGMALFLQRGDYVVVVLAAVVSRWTMALVCGVAKPARSDGLGAGFLASAGPRELIGSTLSAAAIATVLLWLLPPHDSTAIIVGAATCSAVFIAWAAWYVSRAALGGATGDVLGGAGVASETVFLVMAATAVG